ncbi:type 2 lanthipeptide synthetase LanM family protein [Polymorphospora sp. NPDC050346]|uniref:type 2 lanthipeptide synthetase LanM family protein n=1 Tax=Polymorphospora sp. NPDC050346 TaxID=3155780 RepID=UPI0033EF2E94
MFDQILDSPQWWRGLTRPERTDGPLSLTGEERDHGRRRWDAWRRGYIMPGKEVSLDRWERLGLTEERVVELLAESAESLVARLPDRPRWLEVIADAWRRFGAADLADLGFGGSHATGVHESHDHADGGHRGEGTNESFLHLITPLIVWHREELGRRVAESSARHGRDDHLPPNHPLLQPPVGRLLHMIISVLILEVNVARLEGRLAGETPNERMAAFIEQIRDPETALGILAEYPVLARELVTCLQTSLNVRAEFVERLLTDLPTLRETFDGSWQGLADVAEVGFGAGDTHRGGRTVAVVTFTDGRKIVYKPRNLGVERHFNQVLDWLNTHGLRHPLRLLTVLDRGEYGWVEHVAVTSCQDEAQVGRFFWRQGAYLALFYALRGSDLHLENVIAAGEHPVIIDLEAIFQVPARTNDEALSLAVGEAPRAVRESVLRIGLLPERVITSDANGIYDADVSGISGGGGQLSPGRLPVYVSSGTDEVHVVRDRREMPETENRARLDGQPVNALAYTDNLTAGFEDCYRIILTNRDELLAGGGLIARFRDDEVRFIPRPTMTYARLQAESYHPDLLRDSLDREIFAEVLSAWFTDLPDRDLLLASEHRQLAEQDIPSFHTTPGSADLHDGHTVVAHDFLADSGLAAVRARIGRASEEDLRRQLWCIRASMSGLTVGALPVEPVEPRPLPDTPLDADLAIRAARSVADLLLGVALVDDEVPSWLSVNFIGDRYWTVGHAGLDLYSGVPGVAVFLAELGALTGDARYNRPARQLTRQLVDVADQLATGRASSAVLPIGGYGELGGLVYALNQLAQLWWDPALLDAAHRVAALCQDRFADDKVLDVIGGTAGTALAILALHHTDPDDRTLDAIRAAGERIAERAVELPGGIGWQTEFDDAQPLLGFAHGASGIAYSLARIAEATGDDRYYDLCGQAMRFERHHLSAERRNWPDLRAISGPGAFMDAWCHGAAGIGLARAALLRLPGMGPWHDLIREDLDIAVGRVRDDLLVDGRYVGVGNDSICHGDLGLVETLLAAGPGVAEPDVAQLGHRTARAIAERVLAGAPRPGVPQRVTTPGLLMGLAGIGYGLLRTAMPGRIPNVLLLDGPGRGGEPRPPGAPTGPPGQRAALLTTRSAQ